MTATMTDEDIYAFHPVPQPGAVAPRRRRVWPWVLGGLLLLALIVVASTATALVALADSAREGLNISINGESWDPIHLGTDHFWLAIVAVALALVAVLVVVPLALLLAFVAAALGVGMAVLAVLVVAALALSPLWLVLLMLWLLLRRRPAAAATMRP
jgi:hypothetical protein